LRRNIGHPMAELLANEAEFVAEGCLQGELYDVGHYPGAVLSANRGALVKGDVYALRDAPSLMPILDDYEECTQDYAEPHEYIRIAVTVFVQDGAPLPAWTYLYNRPVESLARIDSGDYVQYLRQRGVDLGNDSTIGRRR
jgi:gamma-glutamylcyclotransferase (GGCT)/AIG2-like uncharacterized protein YtfP